MRITRIFRVAFLFSLFYIGVYIGVAPQAQAQARVFRTEDQRWIVLLPDGAWRYDDTPADTIRVTTTKTATTVPTAVPIPEKAAAPKITEPTREPNIAIDSTKPTVNIDPREGAEFLTPEEEARLKAAAAQSETQRDAANLEKTPKKEKKEKIPKKTTKEVVTVAPKKITKKQPKAPPPSCDLLINEIDEFTGQEKKITKERQFFAFTPEAARKYMRADDYLKCDGHLSRIGSYKTLHLTFTIDSQYGQSEYGEIGDNSSLIIKLIDGSTVELTCDKGDMGRVDKIKSQTIYSVFYIMDPSFERQLQKGEVSRVRVVWSVGFEDYEVYDLDFFKEQFKCID